MDASVSERGREVRERLLAAAVELIPERGWTAVSTRVLAERAGVTPSVVHYHFPSLRALLNEAAIGVMRQALAEVDSVLTAAPTPTDLVDSMVGSTEQYSGTDSLSLLSVEAYLAAGRDPQLREEIAALVEQFRQRIAQRLDGHGVPETAATAAVVAAAIDGLLLHRGLGARPDVAAVAGVLRRLVEQS